MSAFGKFRKSSTLSFWLITIVGRILGEVLEATHVPGIRVVGEALTNTFSDPVAITATAGVGVRAGAVKVGEGIAGKKSLE